MSESSGVVDLIFKNICWRLQQLDCSLLGNTEDWWLTELLLSPGAHRFQLLEWVFSRLKFTIPKDVQQLHPAEENVKEFLPVISALGLCKKKDTNLISGNAPKSEQLKFWKEFVNILWAKSQILHDMSTENDSEGFGAEISESSNSQVVTIEEEYLRSTDLIRNCSYKTNVNDLFMDHITLFAPDVTKDIDSILSSDIPDRDSYSFQKIQSASDDEQKQTVDISKQFCELYDNYTSEEFHISDERKFTEELSMSFFENFSEAMKEFMVFVETSLKPVLRSSPQNFGSLGQNFAELRSKQKHVQELLGNLSLIKYSFESLSKEESSSFEDLSLCQPSSVLDEYCQIMKS